LRGVWRTPKRRYGDSGCATIRLCLPRLVVVACNILVLCYTPVTLDTFSLKVIEADNFVDRFGQLLSIGGVITEEEEGEGLEPGMELILRALASLKERKLCKRSPGLRSIGMLLRRCGWN
jgi:hypothetical protein